MSVKAKRLSMLVAAIACGMAASHSWAADTVCSVVAYDGFSVTRTTVTAGNVSSFSPDTTVAVASNFYGPAQDLVEAFLTSAAGSSYSEIGVCHNATGHLMGEIMALSSSRTINGTTYSAHPSVITGEPLSLAISYKYGLFLAANAKAPADLVYSDTYSSTNYTIGSAVNVANGLPALILDPGETSYSAADLVKTGVTGDPVGYYYGTTSTGPVKINFASYLSPIAIADPANAPYGLAAQTILTAMSQWQTPTNMGTSVSASCTSTASGNTPAICRYDNIDLTLSAIGDTSNNIKAGFASWGQFCGSATYDEFVTFPSYAIEQWGVLLETDATNGTSSGSETAAAALWAFMNVTNPGASNGGLPGGSWNGWLTDHCYGTI